MNYGAELAQPTQVEDEAAEVVQNAAGRQILGTGRRTAIDAMRGELGWIPLDARRKHQQFTRKTNIRSEPVPFFNWLPASNRGSAFYQKPSAAGISRQMANWWLRIELPREYALASLKRLPAKP